MGESPYWPVDGLPLAEWLAALRAIEPLVGEIDNRLLAADLEKDGTLLVRTGESRGPLAGRGQKLRLLKGEDGRAVVEILWWKS